MYGTKVPPITGGRLRDVFGEIETTISKNVVIPVGTESDNHRSWEKKHHVVLAPLEAIEMGQELIRRGVEGLQS